MPAHFASFTRPKESSDVSFHSSRYYNLRGRKKSLYSYVFYIYQEEQGGRLFLGGSQVIVRPDTDFFSGEREERSGKGRHQMDGVVLLTRVEMHRKVVVEFFNKEENMKKLEKFFKRKTRELIAFFLTHFDQSKLNAVFLTSVLSDAYKNTLSSYKKKYFDFLNEAGVGTLYYNGKKNPPVVLGLSLASLNALRWFISNEFDEIFVSNRAVIESQYEAFRSLRKKKYVQNARRKKYAKPPSSGEATTEKSKVFVVRNK